MRLIKIILSFTVVFLTPLLQAEPLQPLPGIEQAAYEHALNDAQASYSQPQVVVEPLDKRLRLKQCERPLQTFSNSSANSVGNRTIGVKCQHPSEWTVYVPVRVKVMKQVVVAARPLAANRNLTRQDVRLQAMDIADLRQGYISSPQQVVGQQLKYPLAVGRVVPSRSLKLEKIVRRGEQIVLVAAAGAMEVRMNGTALDDASIGDKVKVKNSSSERVVEGIVQAPGIVKVTM
jgi:flagella basal body P-ring formation protein FlgA